MKKLVLSSIVSCITLICNAELIKKDLLFYENCDSLKSNNGGVKISGGIQLEEGKYGKSLKIERRTLNLAENGNFQKEDAGNWIYNGNVEWQPQNGINDSSCILLRDSASAAFPLMKVVPKIPYAVSFYAKGDGKISLAANCGANEMLLINEQSLSNGFERYKAVIYFSDSVAILKFIAKGNVYLDNIMIDQGVGYLNTFSEPLKQRSVDVVEIPADKSYFNPDSGSISCWINAEWLDPEICANDGNFIFTVLNAKDRIKQRGDNEIMYLSFYNRPNPNITPGGNLYFGMYDTQNKLCSLGIKTTEIKDPGKKWHHLVFNWKLENGNMNIEIYIDGGDAKVSTSKPFASSKKPQLIYLGYWGGAYLNGLIDEFAIFSHPLSNEEIKAINEAQKPLSELLK